MSAIAFQITGVSIVCSIVCLRRRSKKTSKLRVTGLCEENPLVTGGFPSQRASNAENVPIWWRHHDQQGFVLVLGTDRYRYDAVQYIMISCTQLKYQRQKVNQSFNSFNSPNTSHTSPSWASYGMSIVSNLEKTDRVITAPHCISWTSIHCYMCDVITHPCRNFNADW